MKNYKRLLQYIRPYLKQLGFAIICIIMAAAANLYLPWIIKDMVDKVLTDKDMGMLNIICLGIVVVFILRGIFYYGQSYLVSYIGQKVIIDVREVMFRKFQRMPLAYYDKHQTGETMSYITNDVAAIQSALVDNLIEMVTEGSILIGSLVMMLVLDWKLSLLTLAIIPLVGQAMKIFGRKIKRNGTVIQERMADITSLLQESISAIRVVKSFVRQRYEIDRFCRQNELNFQAAMKNVQLTSLLTVRRLRGHQRRADGRFAHRVPHLRREPRESGQAPFARLRQPAARHGGRGSRVCGHRPAGNDQGQAGGERTAARPGGGQRGAREFRV